MELRTNPTRAVLILATVLFLWFLWVNDLWAPDEPTYGEVAREMVVDGQWVVPHVLGEVFNHKPPLFFWLIALLSLPFGSVLELTARLPSVLAALGTLALTMRLGLRWYGARTAAWSGIILTTTYLFWEKARMCQPEALLCLFIWIALSAFIDYREGLLNGRVAGVIFWAAMALAVLTKWLVGLVIPLGIAAATLAADRRPLALLRFAPVLGPLVFAAVTGLWIAAVSVWGPEGFSVWGSLWEHFFQRGMHGMHHVRPPWFYLTRLPLAFLPWAGLLPGALWLAWRRRQSPGDRFLLIAAAFIVIVFSLSPEKRGLYVLPAFPALALLAGNLVGTVTEWGEDATGLTVSINRRWVTIGQGIVGGLILLIGLALPAVGARFDEVPYWTVVVASTLAIVLGAGTLWFSIRGQPLRSILATASGTAAVYLFATAVVYPILDPVKSVKHVARATAAAVADAGADGHDVMAFRIRNVPKALAFYGGGLYTTESWDLRELERHLRRDSRAFAVLYERDLAEVNPKIRDRLTIIASSQYTHYTLHLISN